MIKSTFLDGVKDILSKYGLRKFECQTGLTFRLNTYDWRIFLIDLEEIMKKNPFLVKDPSLHIIKNNVNGKTL